MIPNLVEDTIADIRTEFQAEFRRLSEQDAFEAQRILRELAVNLLESGGQPTDAQNMTRKMLIQSLRNLATINAVLGQKMAERLAFRLFERLSTFLLLAAA